MIDSSPEVVLFTIDLHEHFVPKVSVAKAMVLSSKASSKFGTKLVDPESNRFVTNIDISLSQQILNITNAEIETIVEPNRILNDRRREPVSFIDVFHLDMLPEHRLTCQYPMEHCTAITLLRSGRTPRWQMPVQALRIGREKLHHRLEMCGRSATCNHCGKRTIYARQRNTNKKTHRILAGAFISGKRPSCRT